MLIYRVQIDLWCRFTHGVFQRIIQSYHKQSISTIMIEFNEHVTRDQTRVSWHTVIDSNDIFKGPISNEATHNLAIIYLSLLNSIVTN